VVAPEDSPDRSARQTGTVDAPTAELSSLATTLDEVLRRVATTAEALAAEQREDASSFLFEAERALRTAARRLDDARRALA
jgi:ElaB/YqjD/DUF883 family membrane-anchored ribosome-binding protein